MPRSGRPSRDQRREIDCHCIFIQWRWLLIRQSLRLADPAATDCPARLLTTMIAHQARKVECDCRFSNGGASDSISVAALSKRVVGAPLPHQQQACTRQQQDMWVSPGTQQDYVLCWTWVRPHGLLVCWSCWL
jgi:hypothetical protein